MAASVLFDFDGVIVDSFQAVLKINQARNQNLTAEEYRRRFDGPIGTVMAATKTPETISNFFTEYQASLSRMPIVPGIKEVILELRQQYTLAVISSTHSRLIHSFLSEYALAGVFETVRGYDVDPDKTAKINSFLMENDLSPAQTIFISDTLGDIYEARAAQVETIGVTWGYHDRRDLERGDPFAIVEVPEDLPKAVNTYFSNHSHAKY